MHTAKSSSPLLQISDLVVQYPQATKSALEIDNLEIPDAAITVVLGPNGSGKSTLAKAILGLIKYKGALEFVGFKNKKPSFGYVAQQFEIERQMPVSVTELLRFSLLNCNHGPTEQDALLAAGIESFELEPLLNSKLEDLSGGQLQRVLLARAFLHEPDLVVLDEPEAGLDAQYETQTYRLLQEIVQKRQIAVIVISHELALVSKWADYVVCLNKKLVCAGLPTTIFEHDSISDIYKYDVKVHHHAC